MHVSCNICDIFLTFSLSSWTSNHPSQKYVEIPLTSYVRRGCSHPFRLLTLPHPELTASPRACAIVRDRCNCCCTGNEVCLVEINSTEDGVWIARQGRIHSHLNRSVWEDHAVDSFPGIFMSNAFPLWRRRDSFLCNDNGSKVARNPWLFQSNNWTWVNFVKMSVSDDIMLLVFVGGLWAARGEGRNRRATVARRH